MEALVAIGVIAIIGWLVISGGIRLFKKASGSTPVSAHQPQGQESYERHRRAPSGEVNGPEVYRICKENGMDVHDLQMIELDAVAMKRVRDDFYTRVQGYENSGQTRSEIFADAMLYEHKCILKDDVVRVVLMWAKRHGIAQFSPITDMISDEHLHQRRLLPQQVVNAVYELDTVNAARGYMEEPVIQNIPDAVFQLPNLKTLIMGQGGYPELFHVELKEIPRAIEEATNLESLHFQHCGLTELPSYIFIPSLRELKIGGNDIKIIPDAISKAKNLEMLTAWMNDLEYISAEIGNLKKLKRIDIWGSERLRLPDSIVNLGKMDYLFIADAKDLTPAHVEWLRSNGMREEAIFHQPSRKPAPVLDEDDDLPF